jgi:ATP synthase protein I
MAAGKRLTHRCVVAQFAIAAALAMAFLAHSPQAAMAAALGGGAMALGTALAGLRGFSRAAPAAGEALWRLVSGLLLKWFVVLLALLLGLALWRLPPLPLLVGLFAGELAFTLTALKRY